MALSVNAYAVDWGALPATYKKLDNADATRIWALTQAATYLDSQHAGSDGNAAMDVLKCPGDKRKVTGDNNAFSSLYADTLMQVTWINNGDANWANYTRLWASYASNHTVFTGTRRTTASPNVAMFWDSWTFTSEESSYSPGSAWGLPGTARHNRTTNMVYGDGHAGGITSSFMEPGRSWNLAGWAGNGTLRWPDPILNVGNSYPADYTNTRLPPWRGQ